MKIKSVTKKQLIVFAGSIIVIVLLLIANTKIPEKKEESKLSDHANTKVQSIDVLVENAKKALNGAQKSFIERLELRIDTAQDKRTVYESIVNQWDSLKQPIPAAYYSEKAAIASSTEKHWEEAAARYYAATRFATDADKQQLFHKAMECYEKVLELNPNNVEAKISLASCYVEGSQEPMKGITMLREIEKTDSNNVNLQLSFAFFSEKSGQWDKAIARFHKVLTINPNFIEAHLHLADAYQQKGDKENAIKSLESYLKLVDDVTIKTEIQDYINKLKNS
ncbi:MAG: tetratricopeptide repeat protein [Bacteroidia bacterium]